MGFVERVKITDHAVAAMTRGVKSEDLPLKLLCPHGHITERHLFTFPKGPKIPYYTCEPCTVIYRFQECKLIPGDEGLPE